MNRILVVDDEPQIRRMLRTALQSSGYEVLLAADGAEGLKQFEIASPDLIVTDLAMPGVNGLELTQSVRRRTSTPIIVLSVRNSDAMKVNALDEGADDYLTKPFSVPELLARVRAQLRRVPDNAPEPARIVTGDFIVDADAHTISVQGSPVRLTPKEFDLMLLLARAPGRVLTHKFLLRAIWGPAGDEQPEYLRVLIAGLRKKIERGDGKHYIESEPWVGYRFLPDGRDESV
ncbi:response regulator transcription factor [Terriglobus sp.]|uniref:response regulator transcription factor n=1 Tax=Terriglobus sp. TaxID=1889013 RepID=UPI003B007070